MEVTKQYVLEKEYEKFDLDLGSFKYPWKELESICKQASGLLGDIEPSLLIAMTESLIDTARRYYSSEEQKSKDERVIVGAKSDTLLAWSIDAICGGMLSPVGYYSFWEKEISDNDEVKAFIYHICVLMLSEDLGEHSGRKFAADTLKKLATDKKYQKAKNLLKFGSGKIDRQYTYQKDNKLECIANDIMQTVEFKLKEESAEVYGACVKFLIQALEHNFPGDYQIKFNSKVKNFIPVGLKKTKTNNFFANASKY